MKHLKLYEEYTDQLILEEFLNINLDDIKKKLKNMIGKNRIKINIKDIKALMKKLGLNKGMNAKQIYTKLKKGNVDDLVNKIADQAKGGINNKDTELVPITESFLKIGEFFNKNKWAKYLFVAFILMTIFSAKAFGNTGHEINDINSELGDQVGIELDGSDGADSGDLTPQHSDVQDIEKIGDNHYQVTVEVEGDNQNSLSGRAHSIATGEANSQEFGNDKTTSHAKTITIDSDLEKGENHKYKLTITYDINFGEMDNDKVADVKNDTSKTTKSEYLQSTLGDDDI